MNGAQLGGAAGAGAGDPERGNEADDLAFETVFGWLTDDPENGMCIVCGDDLDLKRTARPERAAVPRLSWPSRPPRRQGEPRWLSVTGWKATFSAT